MDFKRNRSRWLYFTAAALWTALVLPSARAADSRLEPFRRQIDQLESQGQWEKACLLYADLFTRDRGLVDEFRDRYQSCLRHVYLGRRTRDLTYRQQLLNQDAAGALKVYAEVLTKLRANYVETAGVDVSRLFHGGLVELFMALDDDAFRQEHLTRANIRNIATFRNQAEEKWRHRKCRDARDAQEQVLEVALLAQKVLDLKPVVVILEFACGACNSLDEHTLFLTPVQLSDVYAFLEGKLVGIGIELVQEGRKLIIVQVLMESQAAMAGLKPRDRVVRIDKTPADNLPTEAAMERLRGEVGSTVELEVISAGETASRTLVLVRQAFTVPSVQAVHMLDQQLGIGYFQVTSFQETTAQEIDEAILQLKMQGMQALILDVRGNPGGLFKAAIQAAERFLSTGVIVTTQSQVRAHNKTYEANNVNALAFPLVVLIDGETASAAEVVAGALKDQQRATLVGQTTFGKGSVQGVLQLSTVPAGIKITLAKFFSPRGQGYSKGVVPHIPVERSSLMAFDEAQLQAALQTARQLIIMERMR